MDNKRFKFTFQRGSREEAEHTAVYFDSLYDLIQFLVRWYNESDFSDGLISHHVVLIEPSFTFRKRFRVSMPFPDSSLDGPFSYSYCGFIEEINL